jgi:hypothetical protein
VKKDAETSLHVDVLEVPRMRKTAGRDNRGLDEKPVIVLGFVAATAVLSLVAVVLYMIFTYNPV